MTSSIQEETFYEGGPAKGDLIFNLLLGLTSHRPPLRGRRGGEGPLAAFQGHQSTHLR